MKFRMVMGYLPELRGNPGVLLGLTVPHDARAAVAGLVRSIFLSRTHPFGMLWSDLLNQRRESGDEVYAAILDAPPGLFDRELETLRGLLIEHGLTDASARP